MAWPLVGLMTLMLRGSRGSLFVNYFLLKVHRVVRPGGFASVGFLLLKVHRVVGPEGFASVVFL